VSNQVRRVGTAAIAIPLAFAVIWFGGLPLVGFLVVIAVLGTRELFDLAEKAGVRPLRILGLVLAALVPLVTWVVVTPLAEGLNPLESLVATLLAPFWLWVPWPLVTYLVPLVVLSAVLWFRRPDQRPLAAAGITLLGPVYCALLPAALLLIRFGAGPERSLPATAVVFFPLIVTWLCDSFAMWGGKAMGGAKLWPEVSPGKTRSGGAAGVVGGTLAAILYVALVLTPAWKPIPLVQAALMGLVISVVAQIGDLAESLFKREAGVKDSGNLFPGHGGVLDRLDSLYFVLPTTALMYRSFGVL
jgi:phosphatidate cytidylyltransferase